VGTSGIASAPGGGYETLPPGQWPKRKGKKKTKKEEKDPTKYAQKPLENALGMSDRGQGRGSNRIDGLDIRKVRTEDVQGDIKFSGPEKLATIESVGGNIAAQLNMIASEGGYVSWDRLNEVAGTRLEFEELIKFVNGYGYNLETHGRDTFYLTPRAVDECVVNNKKKKPVMPRGKKPSIKSVGSAKTGRYGQGVIEDIQIGSRVEMKNVIEDQFKYINGLRGKVVAFDEGNDPIRIKLDESVYGDDNGCISARLQEIVVIHEASESLEFARWLANGRGITTESVVKALSEEVSSWANDNNIKELMPHKEDLLPVFIVILEDIIN